mmetsp:Transcript_889/g.2047  ORF Transcript_889/g.2047 Transcript_889/m.2047 type:complete len:729 (-) Transcript_889:64-2250(-)
MQVCRVAAPPAPWQPHAAQTWLQGRILRANSDHTYAVQFDDGRCQDAIPAQLIQLLMPSPSLPLQQPPPQPQQHQTTQPQACPVAGHVVVQHGHIIVQHPVSAPPLQSSPPHIQHQPPNQHQHVQQVQAGCMPVPHATIHPQLQPQPQPHPQQQQQQKVIYQHSAPPAESPAEAKQNKHSHLTPETYDLRAVAPPVRAQPAGDLAASDAAEPRTLIPNAGMPKPRAAAEDVNPFDTRIGGSEDGRGGASPEANGAESISEAIAQAGAVLLGQFERWKSSWFTDSRDVDQPAGGRGKRRVRDACYVPGFLGSPATQPQTQTQQQDPLANIPRTDTRLNQVSIEYSEDELRQATQEFNAENLLGSGACGSVYKGKMKDGTLVAIKVLKNAEQTGFEEEVSVLSRFRHPNLVILMGFARHNSGSRSLVYEYLSGGDVSSRLAKSRTMAEPFAARLRLSVALDAASGLSHMHNAKPRAFHRDIKCPNILLDKNGTAKMADFGLACVSGSSTHRVQHVGGTAGYMCPDYARTGIITEYSEVYSFGMVILELLTGIPPAVIRDPSKPQELDFLVTRLQGSPAKAVELRDVTAKFPDALAEQLAALVFACIAATPTERPFFVAIVERLRDLLTEVDKPIPLACLPTADSKVPLPPPPGMNEVSRPSRESPAAEGSCIDTSFTPTGEKPKDLPTLHSFHSDGEASPSETRPPAVDWPEESAAGVLKLPAYVELDED